MPKKHSSCEQVWHCSTRFYQLAVFYLTKNILQDSLG